MVSNVFRRMSRGDARRNATDIYVFVMLLVFPLFTGFKGYAAVTVSKYLFFVICTALWPQASLCQPSARDIHKSKLII